jgi:hypothetical protein
MGLDQLTYTNGRMECVDEPSCSSSPKRHLFSVYFSLITYTHGLWAVVKLPLTNPARAKRVRAGTVSVPVGSGAGRSRTLT